jgi:peptidoglycan/LPS O-acetylase OafA/YrhL
MLFCSLLAVISPLLSSRTLLSLGNLTYCMFLVHPVFQYWNLGSLQRPEYFCYTSVVSIHITPIGHANVVTLRTVVVVHVDVGLNPENKG